MGRAITLCLILVLVGAFAVLNWGTFSEPTNLWLGFTTVQAPLGWVMLGLVAFMTVLFTVWAIALQAQALRQAHRHAREFGLQRDLADKAEASRFTELRSHLASELMRVTQAGYEQRSEMMVRLDRIADAQRVAMDHATNSLAAMIGELEDRLERHQPALLRPPPVERSGPR